MLFYSGTYRSKGTGWGVSLHQLMRQDGIPILFACLYLRDKQTKKGILDQMTDWFYESVPGLCGRGKAEQCTDKVFDAFGEKVGEVIGKRDSFAAFFAMGEECFYAWQGDAELYLFQILWDKVKGRALSRGSEIDQDESQYLQCERAVWENGAGILLGNRQLLQSMGESSPELAECLRATGLDTNVKVEKHLRELCRAIEAQGQENIAAVFCVPVKTNEPA